MIGQSDDFKGLNDNGTVPKTRLSSAAQARELFEKVVRAHDRRHARNALAKGLIDGNPPYEQAKLDKNAQKYRANFNNGEAKAFVDTAVTAFYDLFSEVDTYAVVSLDTDSIDKPKLEDGATAEFDWLLKQDDRFDYTNQLSIHEQVVYGWGPLSWEDDLDWRPKALHHNDVYLPDKAASNVADFDRVFFKADFSIPELYRYIANPNAAQAGWNIEAVKRALMHAVRSGYNQFHSGSNWVEYQRFIAANDTSLSDSPLVVRCFRVLFQEFSENGDAGEISEGWVWRDEVEDQFLYKKTRAYKDWRQVLYMGFYDRGDGYAHSVKGLGVKMFNLLTAKTRLQNAAVDAGFQELALPLRSTSTNATAQQALSITHMGPYTIFPHGFDAMQFPNRGQRIEAALAVNRDLDQTLASNLGQYRARLDKPEGNPRTAFEINAELQKQSLLNKTQIARWLQQRDELYNEILRRAANPKLGDQHKSKWLKLAKEFQSRCKKRGITEKMLEKATAKARRPVGQGSQLMRTMALGQTFQALFPLLPEDGKVNLVDDMISAQVGRDAVMRYNPAPQMRTKESQQRWEAQIENDTLRNRGSITLTTFQNDVIHLQEHLAFASQAAQSLEQGADPADILGILQAVGAHTALHLQRLANNKIREQEFKIFEAQWKQLAQIADQLENQLRKEQEQAAEKAQMAAQAQAVQAGQDPETQLKAAELAAKIKHAEVKVASGIQLKAQKQAADIELKRQQAAADQALNDATTAAEIRRNTAKTVSDMNQPKPGKE